MRPICKPFLPGLIVALMIGTASGMQVDETSNATEPGSKFPLDIRPPIQESPSIQVKTGSLAIQAVQGTPGAPAIGETDIEVDLVHQGMIIKTIKAQLDEFGIVVIDDIPIDLDVRPVIRVHYAGVTYQEVGSTMGKTHPQQTVKVTCYEVTNDTPAWKIPIRQVMLSYAPQGIKVTEILVVMNPGKSTWLGEELGDENPPNRPITMSMTLPEGASHIKLGSGFHDWCCTSYEDGVLVNHLPLMPHVTEMDFSYIVPVSEGAYDLNIVAPSVVDQMVVMLPEEIQTENRRGLELGGTRVVADTSVRYYTAKNLAKDDAVGLVVSGFSGAKAQSMSPKSSAAESSKMIAIVGGAVLILASLVMLFTKKKSTAVA